MLRPEGVRGALLEAAGRLAVGVAHEVAVPGVGRRRRDARDRERARVHPRRVRVGVHQEDRAIGHDLVEVPRERPLLTDDRAEPATPDDPGIVGVGVRVRGDPVEVVGQPMQVVEVDVPADPPGERRVDVRVLEARAARRRRRGRRPCRRPARGRGLRSRPPRSDRRGSRPPWPSCAPHRRCRRRRRPPGPRARSRRRTLSRRPRLSRA